METLNDKGVLQNTFILVKINESNSSPVSLGLKTWRYGGGKHR
jgi:hypothetical protein